MFFGWSIAWTSCEQPENEAAVIMPHASTAIVFIEDLILSPLTGRYGRNTTPMDARMKWNCPNPTLAAFSVLHVDSSIPLYVPRPTRRCAKRDRRAVPDMGYLLAAVSVTRGREAGDNNETRKVAPAR